MPFNLEKEITKLKQCCTALSIIPASRVAIVSIAHQVLFLLEDFEERLRFDISTSKNPPNCKADSFGTPLGLHAIADKIGAGAELGTIFKGRVPQGNYHDYSAEALAASENLITTRILRLKGLEDGLNTGDGCDSYERYIYIHGTNHEERIGEPFSGGCIELLNQDVITLFNHLHSGDLVWITQN